MPNQDTIIKLTLNIKKFLSSFARFLDLTRGYTQEVPGECSLWTCAPKRDRKILRRLSWTSEKIHPFRFLRSS